MKHRKLRIAWSVAWGIVTVLLCVLWVRSYDTSCPSAHRLASSDGLFELSRSASVMSDGVAT